jgi:TRAP transporter TAXI family solute receptor
MFSKNKFLTGLVITGLSATLLTGTAKADEFITIGTGGVTGVYYPSGGAICRLVNKTRKEHGIRCSVESTGGSIYNLNTIKAGDLDIGVVQSDWQYHAMKGTSKFADTGANPKLRALFALHPEAFTVVARADAGVKDFDDLKGKRVNIGNPGSGQRGNFEMLMKKKGLDRDDFALVSELKSSEQSAALCDNKVDAIVFVAGHPNASIKEATTACDSTLVNVAGSQVDDIVQGRSYFSHATIPAGMYRGNDSDTKTFGVRATLVTTSDLSDEVAYTVVKSVFENFESFQKLHPAFKHLTKEELVSAGLSAPLHDGAKKYYKEVGLLK